MSDELDYKKMWETMKGELKEDRRWYREYLAYSVKTEDPVGSLDYSQQLVYANKMLTRMTYYEDVMFGRWDDEIDGWEITLGGKYPFDFDDMEEIK